MSFFAELKRRNVLRVGVAYLVLAWLLVQVGSVLLPTFHAPEWVMQVLVLVLAAGFIATVVFSWAYELTPEGLKREHEVDRNASIANRTARKLDIAVMVLLVAAIAVAVLTRGERSATGIATRGAVATGDARPSVAVLPFVNMSALAENEYFADGLSETLLNMLAQVSGLKVAARTSAFAFKGTKTDIREIARTLEVHTVLEGSVQRAGERVRITAQLIDAKDGSHLWSKSYDRDLDDIFAIQDEIAKEVATELTRSLLGTATAQPVAIASPETHNTEAYDLYLRGLEQLNLSSYGSLPKAEGLFKQALAQDKGFKDARVALARTYLLMADTGLLLEKEAAQRTRGLLGPMLDGSEADPVAQSYDAVLQFGAAAGPALPAARNHARETVLRALELSPNTIDLYELAGITMLLDDARQEEALGIVERGMKLDPLSPALLIAKARHQRALDRYDDALATYARLREVAPQSPSGYNGAGLVYSDRGPFIEAIRWFAKATEVDREDHELAAHVAQYLLLYGLEEEALPWIRRAELLNSSGSDTRRVRMQYDAQSGDAQGALALAEVVVREQRDNRRWVYGTAVSTYLTLMREAGRLDEALDLLRSLAPGVLDTPPAKFPQSEFDGPILWSGTEFLAPGLSASERSKRADHLIATVLAEDPNYDPTEGADGVFLLTLRGEYAKAAELLGSVLEDAKEVPVEWRIVVRSPMFAPMLEEPAAKAAMVKFDAELAKQAQRYRELVASGEIVVP